MSLLMLMFQLKLLNSWKPRERKGWTSQTRRRRGLRKMSLKLLVKRPSTLPFLDYVVVSDTLSGLGAGEKRVGHDPDDNATLTEMMKKKALEDKKRKLDEQAAAMLAAKRTRLQKEAPPAPSESEIDLEVFTAKHGNLLEKIFLASGSHGTRFFICLF
ncbi:hypothetical protein HanRHA438_Chr13g0623631 [Helianthus annuus]|nr:hypothetical protein HanRHA438_Chr13g0623631 [Helianthus annuus]